MLFTQILEPFNNTSGLKPCFVASIPTMVSNWKTSLSIALLDLVHSQNLLFPRYTFAFRTRFPFNYVQYDTILDPIYLIHLSWVLELTLST